MNKLEKIVYDIVKNNPKIKLGLRNLYQSFYDLLPDGNNWTFSPIVVKEGYFFGFHDVTPFSANEEFVLSNKLEIGENPLRMPKAGDLLTVGYWNQDFSVFNEVAQTHAWNYHKGCRLQWVGNDPESFIYNDYLDGKMCANIYSIADSTNRRVEYPIDTVCHNGKYATSFSYERLNRCMPGYGYIFHDDISFLDDKTPDNTGLFLVDVEHNTTEMIVSLAQLYSIEHDSTMDEATHYITHTEFSPDDSRISFLHRWTNLEDTRKRFTRLVTCNLDGSDMKISETTGMVSHYVWDQKHGILAYSRVHDVDGHYVFSDYTIHKPYRVAKKINSDGHQSYIPNTDFFVTDTYPDKHRHAKLFVCGVKTDKMLKIADLKSFKKYQSILPEKHWACDLHPRVSPKGTYVCFDSVHTGKRAVCFMPLDSAVKKISLSN